MRKDPESQRGAAVESLLPSRLRESFRRHDYLFLHVDLIQRLIEDETKVSGHDSTATRAETTVEAKPADPAIKVAEQEPPRVRQPRRPSRTLPLFDPAALARIKAETANLSKSNERRWLSDFLVSASQRFANGAVPMARVPRDFRLRMTRLKDEMPNFAGVLDLIEQMLVLQKAGDGSLRLPPMLLDGPPGVGKTYFAQRFAQVMGVQYRAQGMETASASWVLSGSSTTWSGGGPGLVLRTLFEAGQANPLILLDEVDKASQDCRYAPLNALYALLEPHTACAFRDEAAPNLALDASAINWILTSNDKSRIPGPLLSRLLVMEVPLPNASQRRLIVRSVFKGLRSKHCWGRRFASELQPRTVEAFACIDASVRQLQGTMVRACAIALSEGKREIECRHVAIAMNVSHDLEGMETVGNA